MNSETRIYFVATNEQALITSVFPELSGGWNELTQEQSDRLARAMVSYGEGQTGRRAKVFLQNARRIWDCFHDPYESIDPVGRSFYE
jgi:hypothetical protein